MNPEKKNNSLQLIIALQSNIQRILGKTQETNQILTNNLSSHKVIQRGDTMSVKVVVSEVVVFNGMNTEHIQI
jgi:hypothetical protein